MQYEQHIHLKHGEAGGEADEQRGAQSGRIARLAAIQANQRASLDGHDEPRHESGPVDDERYRVHECGGVHAKNGCREAVMSANGLPPHCSACGCVWHAACAGEG